MRQMYIYRKLSYLINQTLHK